MKKRRVVVALSGGVDSAAAAALLLKEGYRVEAITMDTGYASVSGAVAVAERLSVPIRVVDLRREFEELVVRPTLEYYQRLLTPNPCAWCNLHLKFGLLAEEAFQRAGLYATGHYACLERQGEGVSLRESPSPDASSQSYFLALVPKERLKGVLFPLCGRSRTYAEVVVKGLGVPVRGGKSQDLCFLPSGGIADFLASRRVKISPGNVVDTSGRVLGTHRGLHLYTLGQRRGVGAGGTSSRRYVVGFHPERSELVVGSREEAVSKEVWVSSPNWVSSPPVAGEEVTIRLRYRQRGVEATVLSVEDNCTRLSLCRPEVVVPGQLAVLNRGEEVLGGGEIEKPLAVR